MGSHNTCPDLPGEWLAAGSKHIPTEIPAAAQAPADPERLAALLRKEFRNVWRALRRFGVAEDAADDAAQDVFIILARKLSEIAVGHERRFLMGVAVRVAANARRKRATRQEQADSEALLEAACHAPLADALLDQKRTRELMDLVLKGMTDELRTAFVLFELEGFTVHEVAELLAIPIGTAASRLRRAREHFHAAVAHLKAVSQTRGGRR